MHTVLQECFSKTVAFTKEELTDITLRWQPMQFSKGVFITQEGEVERYFYFILEGLQRLYFLHEGKEHILGFSYRYDFSGIYDSFVFQQPAQTYLDTLSDTKALALSYMDYQELIEKYCQFERWFRLFMQRLLFGRLQREIEMVTCPAEERYRRILERSPEVVQQVPNKYLASYLNMTPETLSRVRRIVAERPKN